MDKIPHKAKQTNYSFPVTPETTIGIKQIKQQQEIIKTMKEISNEQSLISQKQSKTTNGLMLVSLLLTAITIIFMVKDFINKNNNKVLIEKTIQLIDKESENTKIISRLSKNLLDLQNQVQILEKQNVKLPKKVSD